MDLQSYLQAHIAGKRTILVGNAPFQRDRSVWIDEHDIVFRFNLFAKPWFASGLAGQKLDFWFNNLDRTMEGQRQRRTHLELATSLNPNYVVGTPHENDKHDRLLSATAFYLQHGKSLVFPDERLPTPFLGHKQPSTGFYTVFRLVQAGIAVTVIGFTGQMKSRWHDGTAEMKWLQSQPKLVTFVADF